MTSGTEFQGKNCVFRELYGCFSTVLNDQQTFSNFQELLAYADQ